MLHFVKHLFLDTTKHVFVSKRFLSEKTLIKSIYKSQFLINEEWSSKSLDAIEKTCKLNANQVSCLTNPNNSALIEMILKSSPCKVFVWDRDRIFTELYKDLAERYHDKFAYNLKAFSEESFNLVKTYHDQEVERFISIRHEQDKTFSVFNYLRHFFTHNGLWKTAPVDLFMFVTQQECEVLANSELPSPREMYLRVQLCQLFLKQDVLLEIPLDAFNCEINADRRKKGNNEDVKSLFLVKLNLTEEMLKMSENDKSNSYGVIKLMKLLYRKNTERLIPFSDKICDGVGWNLIDEGISMMDLIKDIPFHVWPKLYEVFTSHPNYEMSVLQKMMTDRQKKLIEIK